jgi:hypothetical protein
LKYIAILLFSITALSQSKPIEIQIDSIKTSTTVDDRRKFTLHYHITNLSENPISFVLNTKTIIPIGSGSLSPIPYYKVYEKEAAIDISEIFTGEKQTSFFKDEKKMNKYRDSIISAIKTKTLEQLMQEKKERFLNSIQKLEPKETRDFSDVLVWDKKRYYRNDTTEYYLEEKEKHFIELHINLMAEELLLDFTAEEKKEILKDKLLTKGWYTSNRVLIDFSE